MLLYVKKIKKKYIFLLFYLIVNVISSFHMNFFISIDFIIENQKELKIIEYLMSVFVLSD